MRIFERWYFGLCWNLRLVIIELLVGTCDLWTLWSPLVSLNRIYFEEAFCFKQLHVVNVASRGAIYEMHAAANEGFFVAICALLRAPLWAGRRLASVACCSSDRAACLSWARLFRRMGGSSKGASSSSSFIGLRRVVVLKGGDRWRGPLRGKGNQGNVFMKGVLTLTPLPARRTTGQTDT